MRAVGVGGGGVGLGVGGVVVAMEEVAGVIAGAEVVVAVVVGVALVVDACAWELACELVCVSTERRLLSVDINESKIPGLEAGVVTFVGVGVVFCGCGDCGTIFLGGFIVLVFTGFTATDFAAVDVGAVTVDEALDDAFTSARIWSLCARRFTLLDDASA